MATQDRVRGMNAAFTTGQAGVGEMTPAKAPLRPRRLLVALLVAVAAAGLSVLTYRAVAAQPSSFSGQVTPAHTYYLNFVRDGVIKATNVKAGQQVKAGQVLATQDSTIDQANLTAAQAEVSADNAELAADQTPPSNTEQQSRNQTELAKAQQAVANAQAALTLAQNNAQNSVAAQGTVVTGKQSVLAADTARYNTSCTAPATNSAAPTSGSPPPDNTNAAACAALQSQVTKDQADLASAQSQLTSIQSQSRAEQQRDAGQLTTSQAMLRAAQNQVGTPPVPIPPGTVAQLQSDLAAAQARVITDQQQVNQDSIIAPCDGVVADTAGAAGDVVGASGVHGYSGPAAEAGTLNSQQSSGFQLFVQPAPDGSGSTQSPAYAPVITLYSGPMAVTAQLPEQNMGATHVGQAATLSITALNQSVPGTVSQVLLDPARVPGATYYDVVITLNNQPSGLYAGMTATVTLN
ncbi:MAG TPA: biotin/lipoyl-binding protein [Pseudonocardiaceae bacterium]|nr:biotin/lipoyl-binding protein [Pseudonocardiaceae bacterium]